ncbi:MAG: hypothetical protein WC436_02930 [Candidatus Babeliales bacterium]
MSEIKEVKIYPSIFNLFYYMLPLILTLVLITALFFVGPKLLLKPQHWLYSIVEEKLQQIDAGLMTEGEFLEAIEKPEKVNNVTLILVYSTIFLSILIEIFLLILEIIFFTKSFKRLIRYLKYKKPEIVIDNNGIQDFSHGLVEWDKIEEVYLNSAFNFIFYLGPWYPKSFYYLKLIPKDKKDKNIRVNLLNINKKVSYAFEFIKQHKDIKLGF